MEKTIYATKYAALRRWLVAAREQQELSIRDLGGRLDAPSSFITKTELGERRLDVYEYVQYCEALGIDPKEGLDHLLSN